MNLKKTKYLFFVISALLITLACQAVYIKQNNQIIVKQLDFPLTDDSYNTIVLVNEKLIAFLAGYKKTEGTEGYREAHVELGATEFQGLTLPDDPQCDLSTGYAVSGIFPDGKLQIAKLCNRKEGTDRYLMSYDWETNSLEDIAGILPAGPTMVSWNPDQTIGIASLSNAFGSRTFYLIYPGGYEVLDLTITDGEKTWNVKDDFPDFKGAETGTTGNVGYVDWSEDGETIAFFASPEGIGKAGGQRFGIEYKMYIMGTDMKNPTPIFDGVYYPHILEWSPNSKSIAFIGEYGVLKQEGIWLYVFEENRIINIAKGNFKDFLWLNDSTLVAIKCDDNVWCGEILEYSMEE
jgi:hypothetical protein